MSGNRDLPYPESIFLKLDQDLRVKMKLVRALFKRQLSQGFAGIGPESGMILGELHPQRPVFDSSEELVPEKLVQRHAALQRMTGHAGTEDQIGLPLQNRLNEIRDMFGRRDESADRFIGYDKNADAFHVLLVLRSLARWLQRA